MPSPWLRRRKQDLTGEFAKRDPWITRFTIANQQYGGSVGFDDDLRVLQFCQAFPMSTPSSSSAASKEA